MRTEWLIAAIAMLMLAAAFAVGFTAGGAIHEQRAERLAEQLAVSTRQTRQAQAQTKEALAQFDKMHAAFTSVSGSFARVERVAQNCLAQGR
jgi:uncharacterized protein HemX